MVGHGSNKNYSFFLSFFLSSSSFLSVIVSSRHRRQLCIFVLKSIKK